MFEYFSFDFLFISMCFLSFHLFIEDCWNIGFFLSCYIVVFFCVSFYFLHFYSRLISLLLFLICLSIKHFRISCFN